MLSLIKQLQFPITALSKGTQITTINSILYNLPLYQASIAIYHVVGPCHHGMARPEVAGRGTASDK